MKTRLEKAIKETGFTKRQLSYLLNCEESFFDAWCYGYAEIPTKALILFKKIGIKEYNLKEPNGIV